MFPKAATASPYDMPEWGRYTKKDGVVYAHVFNWPEDGKLVVHKGIKLKKASLLVASDKEIGSSKTANGTVLQLPKEAPDKSVSVIKLEVR
mgnify:FL=1